MEKDVKKDNKRQREEELSKRSRFRSEIPDAIPVMRHAEENIQADIARCLQTRNILELEQLVDKADLNLLVSLLCGSLSSIAVVEVAQWQRLDNTFVDAILDIGLHFAKIRASNSDLKKNGAPMRSFEDPLKPSVLSEQDASSGRIAALKRILATHKVPSSSARLKWYLISRLATIYPDSDDTEEVLVSHIMEVRVHVEWHKWTCCNLFLSVLVHCVMLALVGLQWQTRTPNILKLASYAIF